MDSNRPFYKYEAAGNDFVLFEDYEEQFSLHLVPQICHRKLGIGADGVLLLQKSQIADVKMRIFNQDGSEATMCGNGLRCVIRHLSKSCTIETRGGLSFGSLEKSCIRATLPQKKILQSPILLTHNLVGHLVNTGTPHLVIFTEKLDNPELLALAPLYRTLFNGVNVNLAQITKEGIRVRTFEKGVDDETLSCGTGGAAVSLMHHKMQNMNKIKILFTTSTLTFSFDSKGEIWMEGPARLVFQGNLC